MAKKETRFNKTKRFSDIRTECSAEISLPDYNTDVRKILHVSAEPHQISSFASGDGIECSGEVTFDLVYLDFEGNVSSASFGGDYSFKVKCDTESYKDSLVETSLDNLSVRLMSPRKVAAKATLDSSVTVITEQTVEVSGDAFADELGYVVDPVCISVKSTEITAAAEREYASVLARYDGKTTDEVALIHLSAKPRVERIDLSDGEAEIVGKIDVEALVKTDEYPLIRLTKSLDLSQKISATELCEEGDLQADVEVASASVAIQGDEGGVELALSVITESRLLREGNSSVELYSDMYLCDFPCECQKETLSYDEYLGRWSHNKEISETVAVADLGIGALREIAFADATVKLREVSVADGAARVLADILVSAIATEVNDDGVATFVPVKFPVKIKENVNCDCQIDDKTAIIADVRLNDLSVTADSEFVHFKANISPTVSLTQSKEAEALVRAEAKLSIPYDKKASRVTVYYPTEEDTLYTIAKAYHTTKERILNDNPALSEVSVGGGLASFGKLIIT